MIMSHMTTGYSHKITVILAAYNPYTVCEAGETIDNRDYV